MSDAPRISGRESGIYFLAMKQKIPPEILHRKERALVGEADMHITLLEGGPGIAFHGVDAVVHRLSL